MEGTFGARRRNRRPMINITSLVDVMFLLMIFLLVTTTFEDRLGIDIALPEAETGAQQPPQQKSYLITVGRTGSILFGEQNAAAPREITLAELRETLEDLVKSQPEAAILLEADGGAPFKHAVSVIDVARQAGGTQLVILTQPLDSAAPGIP
jgi:biopolymer transport protein ExbD